MPVLRRSPENMQTLRTIAKILGVVVAPLIVFVVVLVVVRALNYGGVGPDDGALMTAMMVAFPVALMVAIVLWGFFLINFLAWVFGARHKEFVNDETGF